MKRIKQNKELQCVDFRYDEGIRGRTESDICSTITTKSSGYSGLPMVMKRGENEMAKKLRIRKLTPKECMRLMGFSDEDHQALVDAGLSDSAIYHVAGDSIVTTVLVSILNPFANEEGKHIGIINNYVEENIIEERRKN